MANAPLYSAAGIILAAFLPALPTANVSLALFLLSIPFLSWRRSRWLGWGVLGLVWGICWGQWQLSHRLTQPMDLQVVGRVANLSAPPLDEPVWRYEIDVEVLTCADPSCPALRRLRVSDRQSQAHQVGQEGVWKLRVYPPRGMANPDGFDYELWLLRRGIDASGWVREVQWQPFLPDPEALGWRGLNERLWQQLQPLERQQAGWLGALLLGRSDAIDATDWQTVQASGLAHLLVISGLHIGLVAGAAVALLRRVLALRLAAGSHGLALWVGASLATGYALLSGFDLPAQRATWMLWLALLLLQLGWRVAWWQGWGWALLAVLLVDPLAPRSAGFWLSFLAVAALLYRFAEARPFASYWRALWSAQWQVTWVLMLPLLLWFGQVSWAAPLLNLVLIPCMALFLPVALLLLLLLALGLPVLPLLALLAQGLDAVVDSLTMLHQQCSLLWSMPYAEPVLWLLGGAAWLWCLPPWPARRVMAMTTLLAAGILLWQGQGWLWRLSVIDVGQGLAVLIEGDDQALLYDTGRRFSPRFDSGEDLIVPLLQKRGIAALDYLVISHEDQDHAGGEAGLRQQLPVTHTMRGEWAAVTATEQPCRAGESIELSPLTIMVLHPWQAATGNRASCVLLLQGPGGSVLLTGDLDRQDEQALMARYGDALDSDILLLSHHGSGNGSSDAFLRQVQPALVLNSSAWLNRYGHPAKRITDWLDQAGIVLLDTGTLGAIDLYFYPQGWRWEVARRHRWRYWWQRGAPVVGIWGRS